MNKTIARTTRVYLTNVQVWDYTGDDPAFMGVCTIVRCIDPAQPGALEFGRQWPAGGARFIGCGPDSYAHALELAELENGLRANGLTD
jgi:hypothetical protein